MRYRLLIISLLSVMLMACSTPKACHSDAWKGYYKDTPQGVSVVSPCKPTCDKCIFDDAACRACWACIDTDGCSIDMPHASDAKDFSHLGDPGNASSTNSSQVFKVYKQ